MPLLMMCTTLYLPDKKTGDAVNFVTNSTKLAKPDCGKFANAGRINNRIERIRHERGQSKHGIRYAGTDAEQR